MKPIDHTKPLDIPGASADFVDTNVGDRLLDEMRAKGQEGHIVYGDREGNIYREFTDERVKSTGAGGGSRTIPTATPPERRNSHDR